MMMMKPRWSDSSSRWYNNNNNNLNANNNKIRLIRAYNLNNKIMGDQLRYVFLVVLIFSCFLENVVGKSLDIPAVNSVDRLAPPDHLEGVKMEQDGHLNKNFRKEIFLGDLEDFEDIPYDERRSKLDEVFDKADVNKDQVLDLSELEGWIKKKLEEHFHEATTENERIFQKLDKDKDGFLDWDEYLRMYLIARGYGKDKVDKYMKDINTKGGATPSSLKSFEEEQFFHNGDKDVLLRYKERWDESDTEIQDNKLNKNEFLKFRHPEHRDDSMQEMAESIIHGLDKNNDGNLTLEEFVALPPGISSDNNTASEDEKWQDERKHEFLNSIDLNKDGIVNISELKAYLNPRNPIQIKSEATAILEMIDDDYNGKLSKEEVQKHETEFIYSKMVETARNFHDEF